jgi:hypothetical protein
MTGRGRIKSHKPASGRTADESAPGSIWLPITRELAELTAETSTRPVPLGGLRVTLPLPVADQVIANTDHRLAGEAASVVSGPSNEFRIWFPKSTTRVPV